MVTRITGLASGLDVDTLVADMMKVARIPMDKLEQERQIWEWRQEDYRTLNTTLSTLKTQVFNLKLQTSYNTKAATSSDETVATVTASNSAPAGIYSVTVNALAEGVFKGSAAAIPDEYKDATTTKTLWEQFQADLTSRGFTSASNVSFTLNGTAITVDLDVDNINTLVSKINDADVGVTASYDTTLNRFFLASTETGSAATITVSADEANLVAHNSPGLNKSSLLELENLKVGTTYTGVDASIDLGDAADITFSSNVVTVNGMTLNLKTTGTTEINVTKDITAMADTIKAFVSAYNTAIETIYSEISEKRYSDYPPLTDAQREEMTENQIDLWEEKARSGMLRNDSLISDIVTKIRMDASAIVDGLTVYDNLADIGITTMSYEYNGQLDIDEEELNEALTEDPDAVMELFTVTSDDSNDDNEGIAVRMYENLVNGIDFVLTKAGEASTFFLVDNSTIGEKIRDIDEDIARWDDRLEQTEDRYWRQFTAMETALSQMNAMSMWLTQQLSPGTSNA